MLRKVISGVATGLGVGAVALGAMAILGPGEERDPSGTRRTEAAAPMPTAAVPASPPATKASSEAIEGVPSILTAAEKILAEAAARESRESGGPVRSVPNPQATAISANGAALEGPSDPPPAEQASHVAPQPSAEEGVRTTVAVVEPQPPPTDAPVEAQATVPTLADPPSAETPSMAPELASVPAREELLRGSSTPAIVEPSFLDSAPAAPTSMPEPVADAIPAPQGASPQQVAALGSPTPRPEGAPRPETLLPDLPASPAREAGSVLETAPAPTPPAASDAVQPVVAMDAPQTVEAFPSTDAPPPAPAGSTAPMAPEPDAITLAQASEPAEAALAEPGRIQLQGSAMPRTDAVRVRRPEATPASVAPAPSTPAPALPEDAPAVLRFAAPFTAPEPSRPLLSLVLLDDGSEPDLRQRLSGIGVPVSVAVDPSLPDATARMEALRGAGFEVLALASLPARPQPQDVEVFLGPALDAVPEAVAVLDLGDGGLRGRDSTAQMALSRLSRAGLGAVLVDGGFGGGVEAAEAAGVPAAEILRDLDGAGQDTAAILRQLDDAVRRAGQEGEAVVLARLNPETLQILDAWTREGRAQEVAVAPVSALLKP